MASGWIKLYRQLNEHWLWQESKTKSKLEAWIDILLMVNHKEKKVPLGNELITVTSGSKITSIRQLCDRWNWSNTKVKAFLELLQKDEMIIYKSDTKKTVITVVNWDLYQLIDDEKTSQKHIKNVTNQSRKHTNKNDKECIKNDKEYIYTSDFENFWLAYPRRVEKKRAYSCWQARIKNKADPEEMINAAKNYADHCRKNNTEQKFIKHASTFLSDKEDYKDWIRGEEEFDKFAKRYTGIPEDTPFEPYRG